MKHFFLLLFLLGMAPPLPATDLLIEAESFKDKGGWRVDQQFMDIMGSPYLLAHGMGKPVKEAATTFHLPTVDTYYIYVRAYNWTSPWVSGKGPGGFAVALDGRVVGTAGHYGQAWEWQRVGQSRLKAGNHRLALRDLQGFDGRCDAVFLTNRKDFIPPKDADTAWRDALNPVQTTTRNFDFVVVGGGVAGMCAAASAARLGLKTALVNDRPMWGGCNSSDIRVHLGGDIEVGRHPNLGKMICEFGPSREGNAQPAPYYEDEKKDSFLRSEPNITLLPNYHAVDVRKTGNKITDIVIQHIEDGSRIRLEAPLFADCTGDGTIGFKAGADYRMGREGKDEFYEEHAPERPDSMTMGASIQWYSVKGKENFPLFDNGIALNDENCDFVTRGEWTWETGMDRNQITDAEQIRDYGLMAVYCTWSWLKNHSTRKAEYRNRKLAWVGYVSGKRESRRLLGDYILSEEDIMKNVRHEDASFATTWSIDLHYPDSVNQRQFPGRAFKADTRHQVLSQPYDVPYRCLYSRNVDNLFMAGRDISVTHVALGTTRVMRTCGMAGEVVGMAAHLCRKHGTLPRGVYRHHLGDLKALMAKGAGRPDAVFNQGYNVWNPWSRTNK